METKKTEKANIEKHRIPITAIGMLFIGSLVLASFSFTEGIEKDERISSSINSSEIQFIEEVVKQDQPEPIIEQQEILLPPDENIHIDSNSQDIPDSRIIVITPPDFTHGDGGDIVVEQPIIDFPDTEASFPGGAAALQRWISENVQYPQASIEMNEQGKVYLSFVVETDGSISNISIDRGVSPDLDKEAKRVLRKMPNWEAGEAKGKKARTRCRLPINFTLN